MSADTKLNPDGELIPVQRHTDMCTAATRQSTRLAEKAEQQVLKSDQMNEGPPTLLMTPTLTSILPSSRLEQMDNLYAYA